MCMYFVNMMAIHDSSGIVLWAVIHGKNTFWSLGALNIFDFFASATFTYDILCQTNEGTVSLLEMIVVAFFFSCDRDTVRLIKSHNFKLRVCHLFIQCKKLSVFCFFSFLNESNMNLCESSFGSYLFALRTFFHTDGCRMSSHICDMKYVCV